jgi:hypothetical protein
MDPVGLSFENFDALGAYRTQDENGLPIDPSGDFDGQPFLDPTGLGAAMRQSPKVQACLVRRIYRYTMGHLETPFDNAQIEALTASFGASGNRFDPLILSLVTSEGFLGVAPPTL